MTSRAFRLAPFFVVPLPIAVLAYVLPSRPKTSLAANKFGSPFIQDLTQRKSSDHDSKDSIMLISGSNHRELNEEIASRVGVPLAKASIKRFADGESCAAPVDDSILELLMTVAAVRRSSASRVTAVIPYFGYKHHRRGAMKLTSHDSRFLSSAAMDFAKMLTVVGVDRVIAVDLQRPGQGGEACFFDNSIPLESVLTGDHLLSHLKKIQTFGDTNKLVIVSPNSESIAKARKFQLDLCKTYPKATVKLASFFHRESTSGPSDPNNLTLLTSDKAELSVKGADIVIVDDIIDSATTLSVLANRLHLQGARNIYVCASHGLFTENSMKLIDSCPVTKVFVTNSLPLPKNTSSKVIQLSVAHLLADVIVAEHLRKLNIDRDEEFTFEEE